MSATLKSPVDILLILKGKNLLSFFFFEARVVRDKPPGVK